MANNRAKSLTIYENPATTHKPTSDLKTLPASPHSLNVHAPVPTAPLTTRFSEKEERAQPRVNLPMISTKSRVIPLHSQTKIGLPPQPVTPQILQPAPPYTNSFQDFLHQPLKLPPRIALCSPISSFQNHNLRAQPQPHWVAKHIFNNKGKKLSLDALLSGLDGDIWKNLLAMNCTGNEKLP